jgi:spore germination protein KB
MKEKITAYQLLVIMILTPYPTAALFYLAPETKQDIWIALIFYAGVSIIIQSIYISMFKKYPNDTIVTYLPKVYGKFLGYFLSALYIIYFIYLASRNLRDFTELILVFSLQNFPMIFVAGFLMITVTYSVYKGIENLSSLAQAIIIILLIGKILAIFLLKMTDGVFQVNRFLPILMDGVKPILTKGWSLIFFPYGEFIVSTMFYTFVIERTRVRKTVYFAVIFEAVLLIINNLIFLCALGYHFASSVNYPLLETYRLIHIGEFLSRLEILLLILMIFDGFVKLCIFMYAGVLGIYQLNKNKHWGLNCLIVGIIITISSILIAQNYPEHVKIGLDYTIKYIHIPMQVGIPLLTLIVFYIKKYVK